MNIDFLINKFNSIKKDEAIVYQNKPYTYGWLIDRIEFWSKKLNIKKKSVVALESDFTPDSIAMFLMLVKNNNIIVPLSSASESNKINFLDISKSHYTIKNNKVINLIRSDSHKYYKKLNKKNTAGLVVFSSGSTGESKASVHDMMPILNKFKVPKRKYRSLIFLLFDHLGGINTMLYSLSNGGCLIIPEQRNPKYVLETIQDHNVELLPTTPSFLNIMIFSELYKKYDLSSLKIISYGTEIMHEHTLNKLNEIFPNVKLLQTYGLSELGVMRSKSESNNSLWVKIGGEQFKTRVIKNKLEIKSDSAMLGYLNADSPFTNDGWFKTNDLVETKDEYFKILGRQSEIINVGGEKVYPSEIENLLLQMNEIEDVSIFSEKNMILGNIVCAKIKLKNDILQKTFKQMLKLFCKGKIEKYKIPMKLYFSDNVYNNRYKKIRRI